MFIVISLWSRFLTDDPKDTNIPESEGSWELEGPGISSNKFLKPLNIKKVNIGSLDKPKFANIGDYMDDNTVGKITDLLHKFLWDTRPTKFYKMKGIVGDLGEKKIPLKPYAKSVK